MTKEQLEVREMMLTRQSDIVEERYLNHRVTLIGAGAIGSFTALALAKMGFHNLTVFDGDTIAIENMNCQFYPLGAIGEKKADTLKELIQLFSDTEITAIGEPYQGPRESTEQFGPFPGIVITCVDNMAARRLVWENHKGHLPTTWFIDPRMGGEYALLYTINPNDPKDQETYEKTLYTDSEAVAERCTARATIYTALLLAGMVCKAVKDVVTGSPYPRVMDWNIKDNAPTIWKGGVK